VLTGEWRDRSGEWGRPREFKVQGSRHCSYLLDRIGPQPAPLVRELFRNPVTAPGTGDASEATVSTASRAQRGRDTGLGA
jgi:hypothetical protein